MVREDPRIVADFGAQSAEIARALVEVRGAAAVDRRRVPKPFAGRGNAALASLCPFAYEPALQNRPASKGCRGGSFRSFRCERDFMSRILPRGRQAQESQMPKLKTKSGAKKRFKITGTGKVVYAQRGKQHGMIKRTPKQIRNLRGTAVMFKTDGANVKKFFLPNG